MFKKLHAPALLLVGASLLAGCAENSDFFGGNSANLTTASVAEAPRVDPACVSLASQIETLKKEGVADKVAQASIKKYKMTQADLGKADQLNRSNTEFQAKCSTVKPAQTASASVATTPAASSKPAPAVAKPVAQ